MTLNYIQFAQHLFSTSSSHHGPCRMDYKEEQIQELEVLESIYPDELTTICQEYPKVQFSVRLLLDLVPLESSSYTQDSVSWDHYMVLNFKLPETYPETVPEISIECEREPKASASGNTDTDDDEESDDEDDDEEIEYDDHGNPIESKLSNLPDQVEFDDHARILESQVESQANEDMLIGMQMCFALVAWIKESCERYFQEKLACRARTQSRAEAACSRTGGAEEIPRN